MKPITELPRKGSVYSFENVNIGEEIFMRPTDLTPRLFQYDSYWKLQQWEIEKRREQLNCERVFIKGMIGSGNPLTSQDGIMIKFVERKLSFWDKVFNVFK